MSDERVFTANNMKGGYPKVSCNFVQSSFAADQLAE